jgi:23S rRNA pseudoU1915 N3-methylase RlmH
MEKKSVPKVQKSKKINKKRRKAKKGKRMCEKLKNIVKNYGKNCALFAISPEGKPYIGDRMTEDEYARFKEFIQSRIPNLINISNFRDMLLVTPEDNEEMSKFKKIYQELA